MKMTMELYRKISRTEANHYHEQRAKIERRKIEYLHTLASEKELTQDFIEISADQYITLDEYRRQRDHLVDGHSQASEEVRRLKDCLKAAKTEHRRYIAHLAEKYN